MAAKLALKIWRCRTSPGHASTGASQEPRRALLLLRQSGDEVPDDQGRPEAFGMGGEQSYEPIVPMKVGNREGSGNGRPRDPPEGRGEQADVLRRRKHGGAQTPATVSTEVDGPSDRPRRGRCDGSRGLAPAHGANRGTGGPWTVPTSLLPPVHRSGSGRGVVLEEPAAGNPHGGVCEGGGSVSVWRAETGTKPETANTAKGIPVACTGPPLLGVLRTRAEGAETDVLGSATATRRIG